MYRGTGGLTLLSASESDVGRTDLATLGFVRQAGKGGHIRLSPTFKYTQSCVQVSLDAPVDRSNVTKVARRLIVEPIEARLDQPGSLQIEQCDAILLPFENAYPRSAKYKHLAFGMATSLVRLSQSVDAIAHWASDRGTLLVVVIDDYIGHEDEVADVLAQFHSLKINVIFAPPIASNHSMSQSHFAVLSKMLAESGPETKWFALLDDDTFFPHLEPLSTALSSLDHENKDLYVGGLTEDWGSLTRFGLMAYGGAGVYLSAHLARKIGNLDQLLQCIEESPPQLGDIIIRDCVYRHSRARLTVLPNLYQHDLLGDLRGFFESGVEPLNLHHWKSWYSEPVVSMAQATNFCGNCFLQRFIFGNDTVLSNGYSITVYRKGVDSLDLNKIERTWGNVYAGEDPKYEYSMGPLRDRVPDSDHKTYYLKYTEVRADLMRQLYVWKGVKTVECLTKLSSWFGGDDSTPGSYPAPEMAEYHVG
ncbi:uncharacterized protein B0I36DRAFT_297300 [Microdochium trichocladiopsis]|uniref:Glycosyltransferase family 31 protein n=1 Tax=Microdochium trichocladiopsis TaxID=1682393 RepID=A0A9P8XVY4_9PEZI|nr:uncharacterized protein B0I36DRAFT_297300 [Microdochium trichocladiopsis]KAH7021556.1 hypothetical protein B0I36DRAFT_297300 [Microdochium trichocladiopsis]